MRNLDCKYLWSARDFEKWVKDQQRKAEEQGLKVSTAGVTKQLYDNVLIPNRVTLFKPPKPIRITGKRRR